jgi:hypothetical protein
MHRQQRPQGTPSSFLLLPPLLALPFLFSLPLCCSALLCLFSAKAPAAHSRSWQTRRERTDSTQEEECRRLLAGAHSPTAGLFPSASPCRVPSCSSLSDLIWCEPAIPRLATPRGAVVAVCARSVRAGAARLWHVRLSLAAAPRCSSPRRAVGHTTAIALSARPSSALPLVFPQVS